MKLDLVFILSGFLAGLIQTGLAQDLPDPPEVPPVVDRVNPGSATNPLRLSRNLGPPRVIGEGGGARLLHYRDVDRETVVITFHHHLVAVAAGGRQFTLCRDRSRTPELAARMNNRGDVALPYWPGVRIFFAPDYEPVNILKLRSDRFLKVAPKFNHFTIRDVAWGEGILVCSGHLSVAKDPANRPHKTAEYPFLSRLLFDDKGEVRDHQILWTTWQPGLALREQDSYSGQHPAANGIVRSLHLQGGLALWKNAGQTEEPYPAELPPGFEKTGWQCTDLATGKTRLLAAGDPVDRDLLGRIEKETE